MKEANTSHSGVYFRSSCDFKVSLAGLTSYQIKLTLSIIISIVSVAQFGRVSDNRAGPECRGFETRARIQ